jgi:hypothetical protein
MTGRLPSDEQLRQVVSISLGRHKRAARRRCEDIELPVGKHDDGCGGVIVYYSHFVLDCPQSEVRYGGTNPMREEAKCSCQKCGQLFDPYFPPYRGKVEAYRAGD